MDIILCRPWWRSLPNKLDNTTLFRQTNIRKSWRQLESDNRSQNQNLSNGKRQLPMTTMKTWQLRNDPDFSHLSYANTQKNEHIILLNNYQNGKKQNTYDIKYTNEYTLHYLFYTTIYMCLILRNASNGSHDAPPLTFRSLLTPTKPNRDEAFVLFAVAHYTPRRICDKVSFAYLISESF